MEKIGIGIEIECILNEEQFNLPVGYYHRGCGVYGLKDWVAEQDSSLKDEGEFNECLLVEFVSPVFLDVNSFEKGLKDFYNKFSLKGDLNLSSAMVFNMSCGSHLHFSISGFSFTKKAVFKIFPRVRKKFKKLILNSDIKSREEIVAHYDRGYSEEVNEENFRLYRECEFNFCSEREGKGIEWRSLNMLGVETWKEFFNFWKIVVKCLRYFYKIAQNYNFSNTINLVKKGIITKSIIKENLKEKKERLNLKLVKKDKTYSYFKLKEKNPIPNNISLEISNETDFNNEVYPCGDNSFKNEDFIISMEEKPNV